MSKAKLNKSKKKKKNSSWKKKLAKNKAVEHIKVPTPLKDSSDPTLPVAAIENGNARVKPKKAKKRKRSAPVDDVLAVEANGDDGTSQKKKKKVTWGENTSKTIPKTFGSSDSEPSKTTASKPTVVTATQTFLALLAETDTIPEKPRNIASLDVEKRAAKREKRLANRQERKAREKLAEALKNPESNRLKALESIEDRNIKNKKLKDKNQNLTESKEKMDAKRPRLDEENAVNPPKKQIRPLSPNRELVAGYKVKDLSEKQIEAYLKLKGQQKFYNTKSPKLLIQNFANYSSMKLDDDDRTPLTLSDVQHFLIYSVHGHHSTGNLPTWVSLKNSSKLTKNVCIVVDGVSLSDYVDNVDSLHSLKSFNFQMEVVTPYAYGGDFTTEFLHVPLTNSQRLKLRKKLGSLKEAAIAGEAFETLQRIYPLGTFRSRKKKTTKDAGPKNTEEGDRSLSNGVQEASEDVGEASVVPTSRPAHNLSDPNVLIFPPSEDRFPRTELLLRSWDLIKERVPVPFAQGAWAQKYRGFVQTKDAYDEVTDQSPIWALDCEMCMTGAGSELTRISVINENFEVVYETLVKPYNKIIDYVTRFSGITAKDLENVWTRIEDVHEDLRELLPSDVILAGHSIGCDLLAMKMFHPYIIDTSTIFNLSGVRGQKSKLKTLMAELLSERVQEGGASGHDSVEDAASCLKLIKAKLKRSIEWGDAVLSGKRPEEESLRAQQLLLKRDEEKKQPTIYPVAEKSIIRCGPRARQTVDGEAAENEPRRHRAPAPSNFVYNPVIGRNNQPYSQSMYTKPIISHLVARNSKYVLFAGDEAFVAAGRKVVQSKFKTGLPESRVQFSVQPNSDLLTYGCENAPEDGISLLRLTPEGTDSKTRILQADNLIGQALQTLKKFSSLVTIMLTGRRVEGENDTNNPYANHGVFMMKIFKPPHVPITIEDISETCS